MRTLIYILLFVLFNASVAYGRVALVNIEDMPGKADFIVIGIVVDKTDSLYPKKNMVLTDYKIQVEENIKGDKSGEIILSLPKSIADRSGKIEKKFGPDIPVLQIGEKYVLFGYSDNEGYFVPLVGAFQGVFKIIYDEMKQKEFVVDYFGRQLINSKGVVKKGSCVEVNKNGTLSESQCKIKVREPVRKPKPTFSDNKREDVPVTMPGAEISMIKSEFRDFVRDALSEK